MLTFQYLNEDHKELIDVFRCEDEVGVELFLKEYAINLQHLGPAITRLYFDDHQNLVGYFTLYNDHVQIREEQVVKNEWALPEFKYFPAVKLHYLGVDSRYRGKRNGEYLLIEAIKVIYEISIISGCNFVTVESLNSTVEFYKKYDFIYLGRKDKNLVNMALKLD
ncbi:N-acetyltransferase [Effusibacillus consociatus]|uniref:N-acetyltransferase n=1 Tax=Effusibacillus consociatus TaxID=1117041 RepID=A0ABV9Q2C9_9BACL